jgi:Fur family transcriptional regulator, ferric uptake regulator
MPRKTKQKQAILKAFQGESRPLSVQEIHKNGKHTAPNLGLRTVYRHIREMLEDGIVVGIDYPGQPVRYELIDSQRDHPHFICQNCNKIFDLKNDGIEVKYKAPDGFKIKGLEITFYGYCDQCVK